ncbi:MAG TPA: hypothetical protein PKI25_06770, partial [Nitrosomonas europaea]|nr:hypothetical protein [Nitrosomonas europaea]
SQAGKKPQLQLFVRQTQVKAVYIHPIRRSTVMRCSILFILILQVIPPSSQARPHPGRDQSIHQ